MTLTWTKLIETGPKKMEPLVMRQVEMLLGPATEEVRAAIKSGYEIFYIRWDKIALLKRDKEKPDYSALTIEGNEEQIKLLQKAIFQAPT